MNKEDLLKFMTFNKDKKEHVPLFTSQINAKYILAVYQGSISEYDILVKYRQKEARQWSRVRTPKHIHWAVDVLIKMHSEKDKTKEFLEFLIGIWNNTKGIKSAKERETLLSIEHLLETNRSEIAKYGKLGEKGEYSISFLILLAKLLMIQEKTNLETAYMFKKLLDALKAGKDIFKIVSLATHTDR